MIFVTVGTHEQPFDRLVEYMDTWAANHNEEVIIQTGYSSYEPQNCQWSKLFSYQSMIENVNKARIVITHGGPSSFIMALQIGKIPIVVPRKKEYGEHVNDHQVDFARSVAERQKSIIAVDDVQQLQNIIENYSELVSDLKEEVTSNNEWFCDEFTKIVNELINEGK